MDIHTIKPIGKNIIIEAAPEIDVMLTIDEHNVMGNLEV